MGLSLDTIEEIRADCFADDVAIDLDSMSLWSQSEVRSYFESGGEDVPRRNAAPVDISSDQAPGLRWSLANQAADQARRTVVPPLPPHVRLTSTQLQQKSALTRPGEWYKLPFPTTIAALDTPEFGAAWLTRAFHAAGTLPPDDRVEAITRVHELELQGVEAQGGAGHKAIVDVRYLKGGPGLHTTLFVKMPWRYDVQPKYRLLLSSVWGERASCACPHARSGV